MDAIDNINKGLEERQTNTNQSKVVTLRGSLALELLRQERLLRNKCNISIGLIPHAKPFTRWVMMMHTRGKWNQRDTYWRKLRWILWFSTIKVWLCWSETSSIHKGKIQTVKQSLFGGQLLRRLVIRLLDSEALTGRIKINPIQLSTLQPQLPMRPCGRWKSTDSFSYSWWSLR